MEKIENKRRFARVKLAARIRVEFLQVGSLQKLLTDNMSERGFFIKTGQPKPVGTTIRFEFVVRNGGPSISGLGVVRWIETDTQKVCGMGIEFLELNPGGAEEIRKLVFQEK